MKTLKDKVAIAGIGWTPFTKNSGVTDLRLALEACKMAIEDAGLKGKDIDGIGSAHGNDSCPPYWVANGLGMSKISFNLDNLSGGAGPMVVVQLAAAAIETGLAKNVVIYRAVNGRSKARLGQADSLAQIDGQNGIEFLAPIGLISPAHQMALRCRRHMIKYGTTHEQLGAVAINQRKNAIINDRAMLRKPMNIDDYMNSRMIVDPFRLPDMCLESDGACAVVLTSAENARNLRQKPVYIMAAAMGGGPLPGPMGWANQAPEPADAAANYFADRLYSMAGITPKDIDFAEIYDCFTFAVIYQIEGYGFCKKGEGGPFVEGGTRIAIGGELPVNTHGGQLSEGYFWAMNHLVEATQQLRHQAGERQVKNAEIGLVTGHTAAVASAVILHN